MPRDWIDGLSTHKLFVFGLGVRSRDYDRGRGKACPILPTLKM